MKKYFKLMLALAFVLSVPQVAVSGEHGGKEHGGMTGSSAPSTAAPSDNDIRNAMKSYVTAQSAATGTLDIVDPDTGKTLNLDLVLVHQRVGKTGDYYYSCADFKEVNTGKMYDLDLDVENKGGVLSVVDVRIHKEDGVARYTYDSNDNRIPLEEDTEILSEIEEAAPESPKEHGGKEHGGK